MRAPGWIAAFLCVAGGAVADTGAGSGAKPADPGIVDIAAYKAELVVLSDDDGTFYVVRPRTTVKSDRGPVFVGDGKVFYEQYLTGAGMDATAGTWNYGVWAPRVPGFDDASIYLDKDKKYWLSCGSERTVELRAVGKKETDRVLANGEFRPRLWNRTPHLLARDDDGIYYYVDRDLDERDHTRSSIHEKRYQRGHRVFAGKKGQMKELPMTNVVADSAGEIYQTKRGDLRIVTSTDKTASWVRGKKKTPLTLLEPRDNRYLVFRELGVYSFLGTACEDL
jgi:hypothetical protein